MLLNTLWDLKPQTQVRVSKVFKSTTIKYPGPGTYPTLDSISQKGFQFLSRWKSSLASVFHPPQSTRFKDAPKEAKVVPGPGQYEVKPSLNSTGSYFLSKFRSSLVRKFGNEKRDSLTRGAVLYTPGPGTYRSPSEFGIYRACDRMVKDIEKRDVQNLTSAGSSRKEKSSNAHSLEVRSEK